MSTQFIAQITLVLILASLLFAFISARKDNAVCVSVITERALLCLSVPMVGFLLVGILYLAIFGGGS